MNKNIILLLFFFFINCLFVTAFNSVSASELVENSWTTKTPMSQARSGLGVVAVDGQIYAIGGFGVNGYTGINERYDTKIDAWITLKPMSTPRGYFAIVTHQSKIYCIGGIDKNGASESNEVYDTVANKWSTKKSIPYNGGPYISANVVNEKIFVISGSTLFMYDPNSDSWSEKAHVPDANYGPYEGDNIAVTVYNKILAFFNYFKNPSSPLKQKVMIYDTETDVWREKNVPPYTFPPSGGDAVATTGNYALQRVYILQYTSNYVYDPVSDTWSTAKNLPTERRGFGAAVINDVLYIIGGYIPHHFTSHSDYTEPLAIVEQYVPIGYSPVPLNPEPSDSLVTSKPEPSTSLLTYFRVAILAIIIIGAIVTTLFFYSKKKMDLRKELGVYGGITMNHGVRIQHTL
ncbi:MAG: hypothetical protein LBC12_05190 [Nitrososphaerota archaeon]|jgi:N-acetylneuraminic acid mutarotase|nr:hypothetical protein [Nitrososphaerota archaeon]